jgi:methyl-accepting chemotaxis protein
MASKGQTAMMIWYRNAPIGAKVALAPALGVVCLAFIGALGMMANSALGGALADLSQQRLPHVMQVGVLEQKLANLNALANQSMAWEGAGFKADKIAELDKRIGVELADYAKQLGDFAAAPQLDTTEREHLKALVVEYTGFRKTTAEAIDIKTGMVANAASFMTTLEGSYGRLRGTFAKLVEHEKRLADAAAADGMALASRNNVVILTCLVLAAALAAGFAWLSSRLIVRPLQQAKDIAQKMSEGDFTCEPVAGSNDATGRLLSALGEVSRNLGRIVGDIRHTADQVSRASQEIATGNNDLSRRTETTTSALRQTAASLEELTATIRCSTDNAVQADSLARGASEVANEGGTAVADVIATMERIDAQAKKIREITAVIDGIAFQTNILALNAAVEAAGAGEQGRGFAVVAAEVRTLAQRSGTAAKEIRELIGASVEQVENGARKVQTAGQTMKRIVESIHSVSATVGEISRAAAQQASGIAQVNATVSEMDRNTQQNAALVQQAAQATDALNGQARRLVQSIGTLRTG